MVAVVARHAEKSEIFSVGERAHPTNERNKLENSVCGDLQRHSSPLSAFRDLASVRQIAKLLGDGVRLSEIIRAVSQITALSRERLPIQMGCTGAPITEILRDADQLDRFSLTFVGRR